VRSRRGPHGGSTFPRRTDKKNLGTCRSGGSSFVAQVSNAYDSRSNAALRASRRAFEVVTLRVKPPDGAILADMLGLTKQIDVVLKEKGELEWRVVLEVHKNEWSRTRALWLLEEKLNAYAGFILDGHMRSLYPASSPAQTRIVVASVDPLPAAAVSLLEKVSSALDEHAIKISWTVEGGMPSDGVPPPTGFSDPGTKRPE
jgi:hypothetical protein